MSDQIITRPVLLNVRTLLGQHREWLLSGQEKRFRSLLYDRLAELVDSQLLRVAGKLTVNGFLPALVKGNEDQTLLCEAHRQRLLEQGYSEQEIFFGMALFKKALALSNEALARAQPLTSELQRTEFETTESVAIEEQKKTSVSQDKSTLYKRIAIAVVLSAPIPLIFASAFSHLIPKSLQSAIQERQIKKASEKLDRAVSDFERNYNEAAAPTATPRPQPTATPTAVYEAVRDRVREWQSIKQVALTTYDEDMLYQILRGKALEDTRGSVRWWRDTPGAVYYSIDLYDLTFDDVSFPSENQALVLVQIDEERHNNKEGRKRSRYQAEYRLINEDGSWYISSMQVK